MEQLLIYGVWFAMALWAGLYISDYYLTIYGARLSQVVKEHIVLEGSYELTPYYQDDVDRHRLWSARLLLVLVLSSGTILVIWWMSVQWLDWPNIFSLLMGGLILSEAAIHMRHFRNIVLYRYAEKNAESLRGRIEYSRLLVLRLSAAEFFSFAALFLLAFGLSGNLFFLGGTLACVATGQRHWWTVQRSARPGPFRESPATKPRY